MGVALLQKLIIDQGYWQINYIKGRIRLRKNYIEIVLKINMYDLLRNWI